jgi:hypothetical protein
LLVEKNEVIAYEYFKFCAEEGNAEAQYKLGMSISLLVSTFIYLFIYLFIDLFIC